MGSCGLDFLPASSHRTIPSAHSSPGEMKFLSLQMGVGHHGGTLMTLETDSGYTSSFLATILISGAFKPQLINVLILGLMPRGSFETYAY